MGLNKENTDNKVQRLGLVLDYLREHENVFSSLEKDLILANLNNDGSFYGIPNVCLQLYDELGILPDDINLYKEFANLVNKQFDIKDKNIIEVGGGNIPRLGKRIELMQDKGTITVYDPNLYIPDEYKDLDVLEKEKKKLKLVNRRFTPMVNARHTDVIVGLLPCGAGSTIIKSAVRYQKDFMIALCDSCSYFEYFDNYEVDVDWPNNFIEEASRIVERNGLGKLMVKQNEIIGKQYPIIYNNRV